jgi:hypothetical protein
MAKTPDLFAGYSLEKRQTCLKIASASLILWLARRGEPDFKTKVIDLSHSSCYEF